MNNHLHYKVNLSLYYAMKNILINPEIKIKLKAADFIFQ